MRVLQIVAKLAGGGAERAMLKIAKGLADRGHDVHLLLFEQDRDYAVPAGIALHALLPPGRKVMRDWLGKRIMGLLLRRWYRSATAGGPFDLTISTLPLTDEVVRLARLPAVFYRVANTLSAEIARIAQMDARKARRRLARYRWLYGGQRVIAVSQGVADDLQQRLKLECHRVHTIYNPFDLDDIRSAMKAATPDLPGEPYVLHVGRFERQKRHDILFDAFVASQLPHRLVLLTRPVPELTASIRSRGLEARVIVAGFRENPFPWYAHASALVLSSDYEGMPNALVEALACGTPVVSTDCPSGPREVMVGEMQQYLVPCGDSKALGLRLRDVVTNPPRIDPAILMPFSHDRTMAMIESLQAVE